MKYHQDELDKNLVQTQICNRWDCYQTKAADF